MTVRALDHLVFTVADIDATCAFYCDHLGMERERFGEGRTALRFGSQKISLHAIDRTFEPKAARPTPGSADLCFLVEDLDASHAQVLEAGLAILKGPVDRTGAAGPIRSIYLRDPDDNLIELSEPA
ncbi:MAG: VOC family protein [Pseudomonadota bacterium]